MRKSFILHKDSLDVLKELTDEQAGQLFKAIALYQKSEPYELNGLMKAIFTPFKNQFERDSELYNKTVERNKSNGLKGGRPKKPKKTQANQKNPNGFIENPSEPKKPDSDSDSDSKNDSDNENKSKYKDVYWLYKYFDENCQCLKKMKVQMDLKMMETISFKYKREYIEQALNEMENWKDTVKKNTNVGLTLQNWLNRKGDHVLTDEYRRSKDKTFIKTSDLFG